MRGAVLHAPGDIRVEHRDDPTIIQPTDAIIRMSATCVCGSDLWDYRGINQFRGPRPMGHEYCGIVEETGSEVSTIRPGQFVIGSFMASDNTCVHCRNGYQSACLHTQFLGSGGAQAEALRVPLADGTLIATPDIPGDEQLPDLLAASDVLGTGWYAAVAADVRPGGTVAIVGDGAVGLLGVLAARQLGAGRIIAMSNHEPRQVLARSFGATDIVTERGDEGVAAVRELTGGVGVDSVLECVGTAESMGQALRSARPGGAVGVVGIPHGVSIRAEELLGSHVRVQGGAAPVRRFLPTLIDLIWAGRIEPGKVFDLDLPLAQAADGYAAMADRRAIKAFLRP